MTKLGIHPASSPNAYSNGTSGGGTERQSIEYAESLIGRQFDIDRQFHSPGGNAQTDFALFDASSYNYYSGVTKGRVLHLSVNFESATYTWVDTYAATGSIRTEIDAAIDSWADALARFDRPIYFSWYHEPTNNRAPKQNAGPGWSGGGIADTPWSVDSKEVGARWIRAARYIVARMKNYVAANGKTTGKVKFCMPVMMRQDCQAPGRLDKWYPGDDVCDIFCADLYNGSPCGDTYLAWQPITLGGTPGYNYARSTSSPGNDLVPVASPKTQAKPFGIPEFGALEDGPLCEKQGTCQKTCCCRTDDLSPVVPYRPPDIPARKGDWFRSIATWAADLEATSPGSVDHATHFFSKHPPDSWTATDAKIWYFTTSQNSIDGFVEMANAAPFTSGGASGGGGGGSAYTPIFSEGFESGVVDQAGGGLWDVVSGAISADATRSKNGTYAAALNPAAAAAYAEKNLPGTPATFVGRFYVYFTVFPAGTPSLLLGLTSSAANQPQIRFSNATNSLQAGFGGGTFQSFAAALNTWYRVDFRFNVNTRNIKWKVDGVAQTDATDAIAATTLTGIRVGSTSAQTYTAWVDDISISQTATDYPMGDGKVIALLPNTMVISNAGTGVFERETGAAVTAADWARLDDVPLSGTADYIRQVAADGARTVKGSFVDLAAKTIPGLNNDAEGGTDAATITTGGSGSGSPWDVVSVGAGNTATWSSAHPGLGALAMKFVQAANSNDNYLAWTTSLTAGTIQYGGTYIFAETLPTTARRFMNYNVVTNLAAGLRYGPTGRVQILDKTGTQVGESVFAMAANVLYRLEWYCKSATPASGEVTVKIYEGATLRESVVVTGIDTRGGNIDQMRIGTQMAGTVTAAWTVHFDEVNANQSGFPNIPGGTTQLQGVRAIAGIHGSNATGGTGTTNIADGATLTAVQSGAIAGTGLALKAAMVTPAAGKWTVAALNGLQYRIGYSPDATSTNYPAWDGVLLYADIALGGSDIVGTGTIRLAALKVSGRGGTGFVGSGTIRLAAFKLNGSGVERKKLRPPRRHPGLGSVVHQFSRPGSAEVLEVADWEGIEQANGGAMSASGRVSEAMYNRWRDLLRFGATWRTHHRETGLPLWGGVLLDPGVTGGVAQLSARGWGTLADKNFQRILLQSRDPEDWTSMDSDPFNKSASGFPLFGLGQKGSSLALKTRGGESYGVGDRAGYIFWAPGAFIRQVAATIDRSKAMANFSIRVQVGTGPNGSLVDEGASFGIVNGEIVRKITSGDYDMVAVILRCDVADSTIGSTNTVLQNIRVWGDADVTATTADDDSFTTADAAREIFGKLGVSDALVGDTIDNALPADFQDVSAGEALDWLSVLGDARWLIRESGLGPVADFGAYETRTWRVDDPVPLDLIPLERYNQVRVPFRRTNGRQDFVIVTASPDPMPGVSNIYSAVSFEDKLPDAERAQELGQKLVDYLSAPRYGGTAQAYEVVDEQGVRHSAYLAHAGDIYQVPSREATMRISSKRMTDTGVDLTFDDRLAAVETLLARRAHRLGNQGS